MTRVCKKVCAFSMLGKTYTEYFVQQLNFSLNDFNMWTTYPVETDLELKICAFVFNINHTEQMYFVSASPLKPLHIHII